MKSLLVNYRLFTLLSLNTAKFCLDMMCGLPDEPETKQKNACPAPI